MKFGKYLIKEGKDTQATTFYHEVACAVYCINSNAKLNTGLDFLKYFESKKVAAMNPSLQPMSVEDLINSPYGKYLTEEPIPASAGVIMGDAKKIAGNLVKIIAKPRTVWWTGPTNDATRLGAADIVLLDGKGEHPVSLKYGAGQLKNIGLKEIGRILFKGVLKGQDLIKVLDGDEYSKYWDGMTNDWLNFLYDNGLSSLDKYLRYDWDSFQAAKVIDEFEVERFAEDGVTTKDKFIKNYCKFFYAGIKNTSKWLKSKEFWFDKIFSGFFVNHKDTINGNLKEFFKVQLSAGDTEMWYAASGGKKILYIPSAAALDSISNELLKFEMTSKAIPAGYLIELMVRENATGKTVGIIEIDVEVRWKGGQMMGKPNSASKMTLHIKPEQWNEIFYKGNMTLT